MKRKGKGEQTRKKMAAFSISVREFFFNYFKFYVRVFYFFFISFLRSGGIFILLFKKQILSNWSTIFFFLQAVIDVRFFSVNISQNGMVLDSLKQGKIPLKKKLELGR